MAAKGQTLAEFEPLHPAERKLLVACRDGEAAVIANSRPEKLTPDNHVRADFIRFLARGGDGDAPVHEAGVGLIGAVVIGQFDLSGVTVPYLLRLMSCLFQTQNEQLADANLAGAMLESGVFLTGSKLRGLIGNCLYVKGDIRLNGGFYATGKVWLNNARVGGNLQCGGGKFLPSEGGSLSFDCAEILGAVFLNNGFYSKGLVRFSGAKIGANLECTYGKFLPNSAEALQFDGAKINGSVFLDDDFCAMGTVRCPAAIVSGNFDCTGGSIISNSGRALNIERAKISGSMYLRNNFRVKGDLGLSSVKIGDFLDFSFSFISGKIDASHAIVQHRFRLVSMPEKLSHANLRHMRCGSLHDDASSWGTNNHLNGFTYQSLDHDAPIEPGFRVKWLQDQSPDSGTYRPQPWRHLQKTLKAMGHDAEARAIGIAHEKERRRRKVIGQARGNGWFQHLTAQLTGKLHDLYGFFTAYGYEPVRLLYAMLFVWLFCALVYWGAALGGMIGPTSPLVFQNEKYSACMAEWRDWTPNIFVKRSDHNWYFCEKLPGDYTTFSPLMYSLDLLLPLVDLFQDKDWGVQIPTPRDNIFEEYAAAPSQYLVRLVVWLEILFGWMASLMLVAVISGMARNTRDDE